jgi:hypothetical protein
MNGNELKFSGGAIGNYDICLTALDKNRGVTTNAFTVKVGSPLATDHQWRSALVIYPNPVEDILHIRNAPSAFDVTIYSVYAAVHKSYTNLANSASIDLSELPVGVYFMKIEYPISGTFLVEKILRM